MRKFPLASGFLEKTSFLMNLVVKTVASSFVGINIDLQEVPEFNEFPSALTFPLATLLESKFLGPVNFHGPRIYWKKVFFKVLHISPLPVPGTANIYASHLCLESFIQ